MPQIRKARHIEGATLTLRDARASDAAFIHALRTDAERARYLSPVPDEVRAQADWLRAYAGDESQAYFIVTDAGRGGEPVGTVRLYGARGDAFSWGSWLLRPGAPQRCAIESALMVYDYACWLGFAQAYFEVRQENASVWRFHERFGARRVGSERQHFQYELPPAAMRAGMARYRRYLPDGIRVVM